MDNEWLVMVYLVASAGELWDALDGDRREIASADLAGAPVAVTVFQQERDGSDARRFRFPAGECPADGERWRGRDGADPATLAEFVSWSRAQVRARHEALCIGSHGTGFSLAIRGAHRIDRDELARTLQTIADTRRLDVFAMDACATGTLDVAGDVAGCADVMVGSPTPEPLGGWDYRALITGLVGCPNTDPETWARSIVTGAGSRWVDGDGRLAQVALRSSAVAVLKPRLDALTRALIDHLSGGGERACRELDRARRRATRYDDGGMVDLGELCGALAEDLGDPVFSVVRAVACAVDDLVIDRFVWNGGGTGVAVYVPDRYQRFSPRYEPFMAEDWRRLLQAFSLVPA